MAILGSITLYTGCTHAGKTQELLKCIKKARRDRKKVMLFIPQVDKKSSPFIYSLSSKLKLRANQVNYKNPMAIFFASRDYEIIAIDEAQVFTKELKEVVKKMFLRGQKVFITALDVNYRGKPFVTTAALKLLPETNIVHKIALCEVCGGDATRTYRRQNILISTRKLKRYEPRCIKCWMNGRKEKE